MATDQERIADNERNLARLEEDIRRIYRRMATHRQALIIMCLGSLAAAATITYAVLI